MKFILIYLYLKEEDNSTIFYNTAALLSLQPHAKHTSNTLLSYRLEQWFRPSHLPLTYRLQSNLELYHYESIIKNED